MSMLSVKTKSRVNDVLDLVALGSAGYAGIIGEPGLAVAFIALYMFMNLLDAAIKRW